MLKIQIGKNGVTPTLVDSIKNAFKNNKMLRIAVLKGAVRDKEKVKEMADQIVAGLNGDFKYKIIGFVIVMRRYRPLIKKTA